MAEYGSAAVVPGSEAARAPEAPAKGREAVKERWRLVHHKLRSLVSSQVCTQQSAGLLSRGLLAAAVAARKNGCHSVAELEAALQRERRGSVSAWLHSQDCGQAKVVALRDMLWRLELLHRATPFVSFLETHLDEFVSVVAGQYQEEADGRAWKIVFLVQLSKLCPVTRALVLPSLLSTSEPCMCLAREWHLKQQMDPVSQGVCKQLASLGGRRPARFWEAFGEQLAAFNCGRVAGKLDDFMIDEVVFPPKRGRRSREPERQSALQVLCRHDDPEVRRAAMFHIRQYLVKFGWKQQ